MIKRETGLECCRLEDILKRRQSGWCAALAGAVCLFATVNAQAQGEPVPAEATPPAEVAPAPAPVEAAPPPEATPPAEPPPAVEADVSTDTGMAADATTESAVTVDAAAADAETAPITEEDAPKFPSDLNVGMGLRVGAGLTFDDPAADGPSLALQDGVVNQFNARPYFSGQLTESVGFTVNLETTQSSVAILDAIVQLKVVDEFQIWFGQHIPAMERNNFNGPFYNNGWNLPILVHTLPFDIAGRDRGATVWGLVADGIFKYHVSLVDLHPAEGDLGDPDDPDDDVQGAGLGNARFAARATINLLDPENYYYTSGTYYGAQDTLALGVVYQAQQGPDAVDGTDLDNDLSAFTADLLFEKNLDTAGTITLEGGYWNFGGTGDNYVANAGTVQGPGIFGTPAGGDSSFLVGVSWLTPEKVGIGKIQPLAKLQMVSADGSSPMALDVGVGYIIDDFNHRWHLNFRHQDMDMDGVDPIDILQIGAQIQL